MTYARIENGAIAEYPVYEGDIRLRYPNVSFPPQFDPPEGYVPMVDVVPPQIDHTQNISEGEPQLVDGVWTRQWVVTDATAEQLAERAEAKWGQVRAERNAKLTACDWTQLSDAPLTNVQTAEWATYRQALRDITAQPDPFKIDWPKAPA